MLKSIIDKKLSIIGRGLTQSTVYRKTSAAENFCVFHSTTNLFLRIMVFLVSNISLQNAIAKVLPQIAIFHSKYNRGCFPVHQIFKCAIYHHVSTFMMGKFLVLKNYVINTLPYIFLPIHYHKLSNVIYRFSSIL